MPYFRESHLCSGQGFSCKNFCDLRMGAMLLTSTLKKKITLAIFNTFVTGSDAFFFHIMKNHPGDFKHCSDLEYVSVLANAQELIEIHHCHHTV